MRRKAVRKRYRQWVPTYHALHVYGEYPSVILYKQSNCQGSHAAPAADFLCFSQLSAAQTIVTLSAVGTRKDFTSAVSRPPVYDAYETPSVLSQRLSYTTKIQGKPHWYHVG